MKKIIILMAAILLIVSCQPSPTDARRPKPTTTSSTTTSTTTTSITTTTIVGSDSTAALQADLNDGSLFVDRQYIVNGMLKPPANSIITFGTNGSFVRTIIPTANTTPFIMMEQSGVTIRNARITGTNPCYWTNTITYNPASIGEKYSQWAAASEEQAAFYVKNKAGNIIIENAIVRDVWGDAVTLLDAGSNITITNLDARCLGRSGISNVNSDRVTVTGGKVSGAFWWALNIEPFNTRVVSNYRVSGMEIGYSRNYWLFVGGPYFNCQVFNVDATGNTLLPTSSRPAQVNSCAVSQVKY
jgi:hypothetical protein